MIRKLFYLITGILLLICFSLTAKNKHTIPDTDPALVFRNPPASASPGVLWMWMGSNVSKEGITNDLEALKNAGFKHLTC